MNPYTYQQQPYLYQQPTAGPPQPQWQGQPRPARSGWQDPRLPHAPPTQSPLPPNPAYHHHQYPPQPQYYTHQPFHGPPPAQNSNGWEASYNQGHHPSAGFEAVPPLPPRPSSAVGSSGNRPEHGQYSGHQGTLGTDDAGWQEYSPSAWDQGGPPPPPPRPAEYQAQSSTQHGGYALPHDQYSHRPASHHYDPIQHDWAYGGQVAWQNNQQQSSYPTHTEVPFQPYATGPVSPIDHNTSQWSTVPHVDADRPPSRLTEPYADHPAYPAQDTPPRTSLGGTVSSTALGSGGPSDWEHFNPSGTYDSLDGVSSQQSPVAIPRPTADLFQSPAQLPATPLQTVQPSELPVNSGSRENLKPQRTDGPIPLAQPPLNTGVQSLISEEEPEQQDAERTTNPATPIGPIKRSDTIDSLISAWTKPLEVSNKAKQFNVDETAQATITTSPPEAIQPEPKIIVKTVDPYEDLEPEFRASLRRFVGALRNEAAAETDEQKFEIFQAFVTKELRLRSVLYGTESQAEPIKYNIVATKAVQASGDSEMTSSVKEGKNVERIAEHMTTVAEPEAQNVLEVATQPLDDGISTRSTTSWNGEDEESAYSPGGRPMLGVPAKVSAATSQPSMSKPTDGRTSSPSDNAPMLLSDYEMPDTSSPWANAPIVLTPFTESEGSQNESKAVPQIKFEPDRPVYTPFRYNETPTAVPVAERPASEAYTSLRTQVSDSGRLLATEPSSSSQSSALIVRSSTPGGRQEHEEAFLGLLRQQSKLSRKTPGPPEVASPLRIGSPAVVEQSTSLSKAVSSLRSILPSVVPKLESVQNQKLTELKINIAAILEDFGYIHQMVLQWDKVNRQLQRSLDQERHERQAESESRIDALFNDNEIGYAQIGELEAEFKLEEARKKYTEDERELQSFVDGIFTPVTQRLQKELAQLSAQYTIAIDMLELDSSSACTILRPTNRRSYMVEVMSVILTTYQKIEARHQKVAEAHFERERRRKRLELNLLYTNGDTAGVRELEKDFSTAEKMQILHETRARDTRANKLMDSFDRATVRGLGNNQAFIDDVLEKVKGLRDAIGAHKNAAPDPATLDGIRLGLQLAQQSIDFVLADSRKLLATSNVADSILNDADYAVSVAEAKVANADGLQFQKLHAEKAKEDAKIVEDTESRMSSISKTPVELTGLIQELAARINDNDTSHRDRLQRALDEAKRRNAQKQAH